MDLVQNAGQQETEMVATNNQRKIIDFNFKSEAFQTTDGPEEFGWRKIWWKSPRKTWFSATMASNIFSRW